VGAFAEGQGVTCAPTWTSHDWLVPVIIRTAVVADLDVLRGLFRRASLSNEGDRDHLVAHPDMLVLSDKGIRQERTRVAVEPAAVVLVVSTICPAAAT
jgi:hypothetical protein